MAERKKESRAIAAIFGILVFIASVHAQVSPNPVADAEIRDNSSQRMRSIQLERIKRDANKLRPNESSREAEIRFAEIKDDFEGIQKLETLIVQAYTKGLRINYEKIRESSLEMKKRAVRLGVNLFNTGPETEVIKTSQNLTRKSVRDLIIELDKTIANFVGSPTFTKPTVVDTGESARAEKDLGKLIKLSVALSTEAAKLSKTLN